MATEREEWTEEIPQPNLPDHKKQCFVVMPFGRTPEEKRYFKGWYDEVIAPSIRLCDYEPKLSVLENASDAINDEICEHLVFDPMAVVDLGGMTPEQDANPNVMYELGLRHAFDLPTVLLGWEGQHIPFDVGNQRIIREVRDLAGLEPSRKRLAEAIREAEKGKFYRPMEAVKVRAQLQLGADSLSQDSLLKLLIEEVKEVRDSVGQLHLRKGLRPAPKRSSQNHFYTTSDVERRDALKSGFVDEGIACYVPATKLDGTTPLMRLRNRAINDTFYTVSNDEANVAIAENGYIREPDCCFVFVNEGAGRISLSRLWSKHYSDHFYTINEEEKFRAERTGTYRFERIEGWVYPQPQPDCVPLFRLYRVD